MQITREVFDQQRRPRFGTSNAQRMRFAFWEWMIRGDAQPLANEGGLLSRLGLIIREGIVKSSYGPYRARDLFNVPLNPDDGPIWTFDRMGATLTKLADGRVICVGGEHEDFYDPDFHIYNDVVVLGPGDHVAIYGYPKEIFPPTDFHTATLVNGQIILIGALGYPDDRRPGHTPVYSLNTSNYRITEIQTTGESPGWVFKHQLTADKDGVITLRDGEVWEPRNGEPRFRRNFDDYSFDTRSGVWQRLTHRNWHQFRVRLEDGDWFPMESSIKPEDLFPEPCSGAEFLGVSDEHPGQGVFRMEHFLVIITFGHQDVEVVVHDNVPVEKAARLAEVVRAKAEQLIGKPLALDKVS